MQNISNQLICKRQIMKKCWCFFLFSLYLQSWKSGRMVLIWIFIFEEIWKLVNPNLFSSFSTKFFDNNSSHIAMYQITVVKDNPITNVWIMVYIYKTACILLIILIYDVGSTASIEITTFCAEANMCCSLRSFSLF